MSRINFRVPRYRTWYQGPTHTTITEKDKQNSLILSDGLMKFNPDGSVTTTFKENDNNDNITTKQVKTNTDSPDLLPLIKYPSLLLTVTDDTTSALFEMKKEIPDIPAEFSKIKINLIFKFPGYITGPGTSFNVEHIFVNKNKTYYNGISLARKSSQTHETEISAMVTNSQGQHQEVMSGETLYSKTIIFQSVYNILDGTYESIDINGHKKDINISAFEFDSLNGEMRLEFGVIIHSVSGHSVINKLLVEDLIAIAQ